MRNLSTRKKIKNGVYRPLSSRLNPQNNTETKILPTVLNIYMRYSPGVSSKGLNIGQIFVAYSIDRDRAEANKNAKKGQQPAILTSHKVNKSLIILPKRERFLPGPERGPSCPLE